MDSMKGSAPHLKKPDPPDASPKPSIEDSQAKPQRLPIEELGRRIVESLNKNAGKT